MHAGIHLEHHFDMISATLSARMSHFSNVRMSSSTAREASRVPPEWFWMHIVHPGKKYFRTENHHFCAKYFSSWRVGGHWFSELGLAIPEMKCSIKMFWTSGGPLNKRGQMNLQISRKSKSTPRNLRLGPKFFGDQLAHRCIRITLWAPGRQLSI